MSRRIRIPVIRLVPILAGLVLAQASAAFADVPSQNAPSSAPTPAAAPQNPAPQRPAPQVYRRGGVTPPPISSLTLPAVGPSNYTVAHSERVYWGTADRHPDPELYPKLPSLGHSAPTQSPPTTAASVYRYLPASPGRDTSVAVGAGSASTYQNAMRSSPSSIGATGASPFGPPLPPVNAQP